jgi:ketosteroid isomerase-like protein
MSEPRSDVLGATSPAQVIQGLSERLSAGDLEGAVSYYEPGAAFRPSPAGQPVYGREAIRGALETFLALAPTLSGQVERVLEAEDVALVVNRWQLPGGRRRGAAGRARRRERRRASPPSRRHLGHRGGRPLGRIGVRDLLRRRPVENGCGGSS